MRFLNWPTKSRKQQPEKKIEMESFKPIVIKGGITTEEMLEAAKKFSEYLQRIKISSNLSQDREDELKNVLVFLIEEAGKTLPREQVEYLDEAAAEIVILLGEVYRYRKIGTVGECREAMDQVSRLKNWINNIRRQDPTGVEIMTRQEFLGEWRESDVCKQRRAAESCTSGNSAVGSQPGNFDSVQKRGRSSEDNANSDR